MSDARTGVSFLMLAAGAGERLALGPKGLLELHGRPLLCWLADKARQVADEVLVEVPVMLSLVAIVNRTQHWFAYAPEPEGVLKEEAR